MSYNSGMIKPRAILPWLVLLAMVSLGHAQSPTTRPASVERSAAPRTAAVITIDDQITQYTQTLFERRMKKAQEAGAKVVIIELNTPGGLASAGERISNVIKRSDLHTIAFVNPRALSAGAMIALACDEIVMAPAALMGDCAPIIFGPTGLQSLTGTERAKAESPILADFRDSAERNGYDLLLVQSMVSMDRTVYWVEKDGIRRFVDEKEFETLTRDGWHPVPGAKNPVDGPNELLTVATDEAIKYGLSKGTAASLSDLAEQQNLNIVSTFRSGGGERLVELLANDFVRSILFIVFLSSLYAAMHAPGHGFAEVLAVVSLSLMLGIPYMTGYAQWWEIIAVVVGVILLAVELFVLPGFGIAGISGIVLILVGFIFTFAAPEPGRPSFSMPMMAVTWSGLQRGLMVTVGGLFASLLLCWWLRQYLPKLPYLNRLILTTNVGTESAMVGSLTNIDPSELAPAVGSTGLALTDLRPGGTAQFRDPAGGTHTASVVSDIGFINKGTPIVVRLVEGSRIVVRPVRNSASDTQLP